MNKTIWWRNRSLTFALIASLAALLSIYGLLTSVVGARGQETDRLMRKRPEVASEKDNRRLNAIGAKENGRVFAALVVDDYEILKTFLKKGARINVIHCGTAGREDTEEAKTILKDVLIAEVPKFERNPSIKSAGILIDVSSTESEQLAAYANSGRLKIVISQ